MKTYKNLWDDFVSIENLQLAAKKAVKSRKNRREVKKFLANQDELLKKLQCDLINGDFNTSEYRIRTIFEPKKRDIYILPLYPDHIVHHALINILGPIWQSNFIHDSYACIPGKGLHSASQRVMHFMRKYNFVLQCDIRKFFPSVNHQIMFDIIKRKVADKKILNVLHNIIFSCGNDSNLPIGNLTSQWLGNVYLNQMDHFIKEKLHCRAYIRYCDDFLVFSNDKKFLHQCKAHIEEFVMQTLKLRFSKSSLYPIKNGVTFLGYRHFKKFILLKKYNVKKIMRYIKNIIVNHDRGQKSVGQLASLHGWIKWCNSFNLKQSIYAYVMREKVSMKRFVRKRLF